MSTTGSEVSLGLADQVDRDFRRLLATTVLLALISGAVFAYVLASLRPEIQRFRSSSRALQLAHAGMLDQETGLRGYLLVRDPRFLRPYQQGVISVATQDLRLINSLGAEPDLARLLWTMRAAQRAWSLQWASVVANGRTPTGRAALDAFLDRGKALFDSYRADELVLSDRVDARRNSLFNREGLAFGVDLALVLAFALALIVVIYRQRAALGRQAVAPVTEIVSATEAIARGDLESELVLSGASEFRRIGHGINVMLRALAEARGRDRAAQARIAEQAVQLRQILSMSREIAGSLNLRYVLQSVATAATSLTGFPRAVVWLADRHGGTGLSAAFDSARPDQALAVQTDVTVAVGVVAEAVRSGRITTSGEDGVPSSEGSSTRGLGAVAVPLVVGARVTGAIELSSPTPAVIHEGRLEVLQTLATHAAAAIEAACLHGETEELAQTDGLTELGNRRRLDLDLMAECGRCSRYGHPLALIMLDVDHFKRVNDSFGHVRGDEVLKELAETVRSGIRVTDSAYRYGGEEFAVLAPETDAQHALMLAERLRRRIEDRFADRGSPVPITASLGVGLSPPERCVPESLIATADAALYRAKADGRNRVRGSAPVA